MPRIRDFYEISVRQTLQQCTQKGRYGRSFPDVEVKDAGTNTSVLSRPFAFSRTNTEQAPTYTERETEKDCRPHGLFLQWDHPHEAKFTDTGIKKAVSLTRQLLHAVTQMFLQSINWTQQ
jgi:hypothetical protein